MGGIFPEKGSPAGAKLVPLHPFDARGPSNCKSRARFFSLNRNEKPFPQMTLFLGLPRGIFPEKGSSAGQKLVSHPTPTERISTECWGALRGCSKPASAVSAGFLLHMRTKWDVTMLPNAVARTEQPKLAEQHSKGAENTRPKRPFLEVSGRRKKKTLEVVNASSKFHMCSNTLQRTFCESLRKIG